MGSADGISAECAVTVRGQDISSRHLKYVAINERTSLAEDVYPDERERLLAVGDTVVVARETPLP